MKEGFRFSPEAVTFLLRFIAGKLMNDCGLTVNKNHGTFTVMEYPAVMTTMTVVSIASSSQSSRRKASRYVGNKGSWKEQTCSKPVIGYKKSMCYMNKQENGHWLMKEYDLLDKFDKDCRDYVLDLCYYKPN